MDTVRRILKINKVYIEEWYLFKTLVYDVAKAEYIVSAWSVSSKPTLFIPQDDINFYFILSSIIMVRRVVWYISSFYTVLSLLFR